MINALSFDLEYWYSAELVRHHLQRSRDDQIVEATMPILNLLDKYQTKATFFVLGLVANNYPELIRDIFNHGHEIACHGYSHKTLHELGPVGFEDEIEKSVDLLQSITGVRPFGFRAPSFSVDNSTKWAFAILKKYGFQYDSSIFPARTMLYGVPKAPLHPYKLCLDDIVKEGSDGDLVEFPVTIIKLGIRLPIAGGFYFRTLPFWFIKLAIERVNRQRPAIIYIHPWEIYPSTPRLGDLPILSRFVTYYGINSALGKLEKLVKIFKFKSIGELLQ
ncbi:polysaccharide deacetylase family protein [Chloroflexota bacterium]